MYAHHVSRIPLRSEDFSVFYNLQIGNTGRQTLDDVTIRLRGSVVARAAIPAVFKNFGVVERKVPELRESDTVTYSLGQLEPEKRVTMYLLLSYKNGEIPDLPEHILIGIESSHGKVKKGDPALTLFARVMHGIVNVF